MSEVLYRKFRPQSFAEVAGQEPVVRTLRNSVASGRLAHAYLFCGPRGTGKTTLGRLLAKAVNCASPTEGDPCGECPSCAAFNEGRAIDFIEQDAASHNSVDDIRQLRENVVLTPMSGERKVYLLDEVHMLSNSAENALLKTLEEPPPHIIFVLATTEAHRVAATIISRCQRFDLRRIPSSAVVGRLAFICEREGYSLNPDALDEIARAATGSLRDAINGLEQIVTYYGPSPSTEQVQEALGTRIDARSRELARLALSGDLTGGLKVIAAVRDDGTDMKQFCRQVVQCLRGVLLAKADASASLDLPADAIADVKELATLSDRGKVVLAVKAFAKADFRDDSLSSLPVELALLEVAIEPDTVHTSAPTTHRAMAKPIPERSSVPQSANGAEESADAPVVSQPVAVPAPEPSGGKALDLIERVRQACKESDKQLSGLLNGSCEVLSDQDGIVRLGFYHTFHLERIESGSFGRKLEDLFSGVAGRPVKVQYEHAPRRRVESATRSGHLVQAAKDLGAKPVGAPEQKGDQGE